MDPSSAERVERMMSSLAISNASSLHLNDRRLAELEEYSGGRDVIFVTEIIFKNAPGVMSEILHYNETGESSSDSILPSTITAVPGLHALHPPIKLKTLEGKDICIILLTAVITEDAQLSRTESILLCFCFFISHHVLLSEQAHPLSSSTAQFIKALESDDGILERTKVSFAKLTILIRNGQEGLDTEGTNEFKTDEVNDLEAFFGCVNFLEFEKLKQLFSSENMISYFHIPSNVGNDSAFIFQKMRKYFTNCTSLGDAFSIDHLINYASPAEDILEKLTLDHITKFENILVQNLLSKGPAIESLHKILVDEILHTFSTTVNIGMPSYILSTRDELIYRMKTRYADALDHHGTKISTIMTAIDASCLDYDEKMEDELEGLEFCVPDTLSSASPMYKSSIISSFKRSYSANYSEVELPIIVEELSTQLKLREEDALAKNTKLFKAAEILGQELIDSTLRTYSNRLNNLLVPEQNEIPEDIDTKVKEISDEIATRFEKLNVHGPPKFRDGIKQRLEDDMLQTVQRWHTNFKQIRTARQTEITLKMDEICNNFKDKVVTTASELLNIEDIYNHQEKFVTDAEVEYLTTMQHQPSALELSEGCPNFVFEMKKIFVVTAAEVIANRKQCDLFYTNKVQDAVKCYLQAMEATPKENYLLANSALQNAHDAAERSAVQNFRSATENIEHPGRDDFLEQVQQQILKDWDRFINLKEVHLIEFTKKTEIEIAGILDNYQANVFAKLNECQDMDDLETYCNNQATFAKSKLAQRSPPLHKGILDLKLGQLQRSIQSCFADIKDGFLIVLDSREKETQAAITEAREIFNKELSKFEHNSTFQKSSDIQAFHRQVQQLILRTTRTLLPIQMKEVKTALEATFRSHKKSFDQNFAKDVALGIDLGTTNTCVSVWHGGEVKIIPNRVGPCIIPSYVSFSDDGNVDKIGVEAKDTAYQFSENTIFDAKRIIGRKFDDDCIQRGIRSWPFKVVNDGGAPKIEVADNTLISPEQVSAELLNEMKIMAEEHLGSEISKAVITVPAYFSDTQRQATVDAGKCAGLNVLAVLPEPVAASLAFKLDECETPMKHILIYDLGGGTFDVAILKITHGQIETLAIGGDSCLGGRDFDENMMMYCVQEFKRQTGVDLLLGKDSTSDLVRQDARRRLQILQSACEMRKPHLSAITCDAVEINVRCIYKKEDSTYLHLKVEITRSKFEEINQTLFQRSIDIVDGCMKSKEMTNDMIDDIVLVGGSTRIPKIREMLSNYFGGAQLSHKVHPDQAVAHGAAIRAAILNGQISQGDRGFVKIQDITPKSLGIEVIGQKFSKIIPRYTKIPKTIQETYTTSTDNQVKVKINAYQGEDLNIAGNKLLGSFMLGGIPPAAKGVEKVDVTMEINSNGILNVTAVSQTTSGKEKISIASNKWLLSDKEIGKISNRIANRVRSIAPVLMGG